MKTELINIVVNSEEETRSVAVNFASQLNPGDFISLVGNLGAGKTFFIKCALAYFGIDEVNSPTFSIVNEYYGKGNIYHLDFYRIKNIDELLDLGYEEYLNDADAIKFVEWADMFEEAIPKVHFEVKIEYISDKSRKILIEKYD